MASEAAMRAAEKICQYVSECHATNTRGEVGDIAEVIATLLAAKDTEIAEAVWLLKWCRSQSDNSRALNDVIDAFLRSQE